MYSINWYTIEKEMALRQLEIDRTANRRWNWWPFAVKWPVTSNADHLPRQ